MERVNLEVIRGDNKSFCLEVTNENNLSYDITGWTVYFTVKSKPTDSDEKAVIKLDIDSHTSPLEGKTQINLTPTETSELSPGMTYYYDIQFKKSDGKIITPMQGFLKVERDITIRD